VHNKRKSVSTIFTYSSFICAPKLTRSNNAQRRSNRVSQGQGYRAPVPKIRKAAWKVHGARALQFQHQQASLLQAAAFAFPFLSAQRLSTLTSYHLTLPSLPHFLLGILDFRQNLCSALLHFFRMGSTVAQTEGSMGRVWQLAQS